MHKEKVTIFNFFRKRRKSQKLRGNTKQKCGVFKFVYFFRVFLETEYNSEKTEKKHWKKISIFNFLNFGKNVSKAQNVGIT